MKNLKSMIFVFSVFVCMQTGTKQTEIFTRADRTFYTNMNAENMLAILKSIPYTANAIGLNQRLKEMPVMQNEAITEWLSNAKARLVYGSELYSAAWHYGGDPAKVKELLKNKDIDLNWRDPDGITPLMMAACDHIAEIVELLLEAGANPNLQDDFGKTALAWARFSQAWSERSNRITS